MIEIDKRIIEKSEYLEANGGGSVIGVGCFAQRTHNSADYENAPKLILKMCDKIIEKNKELEPEYNRLVASGKIRPATYEERLIIAAHGHEDNLATHAARRVCDRRKINWKGTTKIEF